MSILPFASAGRRQRCGTEVNGGSRPRHNDENAHQLVKSGTVRAKSAPRRGMTEGLGDFLTILIDTHNQ